PLLLELKQREIAQRSTRGICSYRIIAVSGIGLPTLKCERGSRGSLVSRNSCRKYWESGEGGFEPSRFDVESVSCKGKLTVRWSVLGMDGHTLVNISVNISRPALAPKNATTFLRNVSFAFDDADYFKEVASNLVRLSHCWYARRR